MTEKISHIGIVVKSIDHVIPFYRDLLGLVFVGTEEIPEQKVRVAVFRIGDINIELLEPTDKTSPVFRFLEKRGGGIHHLALKVNHIDQEIEHLQEKEIEMIDPTPRQGAHNSRIAFIHPRSAAGTLIELVEEGI